MPAEATDHIAIDPGGDGAIAWSSVDGIQVIPMPKGMTEQADFLRELAATLRNPVAAIERVGAYRQGNAGPSACKFARHCGNIEAMTYVLGISATQVAPQTWMRKLGTFPKEKAERKRAIKEMMARLYPHLKVTLTTADALGILTWSLPDATSTMR